jgi:hypothetical protein
MFVLFYSHYVCACSVLTHVCFYKCVHVYVCLSAVICISVLLVKSNPSSLSALLVRFLIVWLYLCMIVIYLVSHAISSSLCRDNRRRQIIRMLHHLQIRQLQISHLEIFICDIGACVVSLCGEHVWWTSNEPLSLLTLMWWTCVCDFTCVMTRFC